MLNEFFGRFLWLKLKLEFLHTMRGDLLSKEQTKLVRGALLRGELCQKLLYVFEPDFLSQ
jgi:hypothetical protein